MTKAMHPKHKPNPKPRNTLNLVVFPFFSTNQITNAIAQQEIAFF
jgi:hypothetical protein